jgi:hypothetical protein
MYVRSTYVFFCYGFPLKGMWANNRFREWSRGVIKQSIPRSHWHRGIRTFQAIIESGGVNDTAESASAVSSRLRKLLQKCQSQIFRCHWHCRIWHRSIRTFKTIISIFSANTSYCAVYGKRLQHVNQGPGGFFYEKTEGRKSRDTVPLKINNREVKRAEKHSSLLSKA